MLTLFVSHAHTNQGNLHLDHEVFDDRCEMLKYVGECIRNLDLRLLRRSGLDLETLLEKIESFEGWVVRIEGSLLDNSFNISIVFPDGKFIINVTCFKTTTILTTITY